ncbi:MAG: DUF4430 domain-containing protein [Candidatus Wildermuthbacteria bacterium]|nr:DUF4430 domain-containing protein [Candidatus Wildermuthbacteria bacterium]
MNTLYFVRFIVVILIIISTSFAGLGDTRADAIDGDVADAVAYLRVQETSPGITLAFVAVDQNEDVDVSYLKDFSASTAIAYAKPILALVAAEKDPRTYPKENFIEKIRGFAGTTQLGDPNQLNDDFWGILALSSAGTSADDFIIANSKQFILDHQNSDGGWGWNVGGTSDTNDAAIAIVALLEAGLAKEDPAIQKAISYIKSAQNDDGGFPYDPQSKFGRPSDANSDAWVIVAINKLGEDPYSWTINGHNPVEHLLSLQDQDGGFWWVQPETSDFNNKAATADALIALSGNSFPIKKIATPGQPLLQEVSFRIEGSSALFCRGVVHAATAMDVVKNASEQCGYTYSIEQTDFGPYLSRIGNDAAQGMSGWMYFVEWVSPAVGAAEYALSVGEEVLWYYGEWGINPLRIQLTEGKSSYKTGESMSGVVKEFDGTQWNGAGASRLWFDGKEWIALEDGSFEIPLSKDGVFEFVATKEGSVRSDSISVIVGGVSRAVAMSVEVSELGDIPEEPEKSDVGFSVSPSFLAFGKLNPGSSAAKQVTLTNTGQKKLKMRSEVEGDSVFLFLKIAGMLWSAFERMLDIDASEHLDVSLSIPAGFSSFGSKQGTLILWGTPTE